MALRARGTSAALEHSAAITRRVLLEHQSCQRARLQGVHQARGKPIAQSPWRRFSTCV